MPSSSVGVAAAGELIFGYGFVGAGHLWARGCARPRLWTAGLMTLDHQNLLVVLWGVVKSLQKRVEKLEKKKRGPKGLFFAFHLFGRLKECGFVGVLGTKGAIPLARRLIDGLEE